MGTYSSLESLNLYKMCMLSFHTQLNYWISQLYICTVCKIYPGHATPELNCKGHAPYSNSPNFISPKVVQQTICLIFLPPKFPSIRYIGEVLCTPMQNCSYISRRDSMKITYPTQCSIPLYIRRILPILCKIFLLSYKKDFAYHTHNLSSVQLFSMYILKWWYSDIPTQKVLASQIQ